jgi:ATP citrate (pro-S)-lyase
MLVCLRSLLLYLLCNLAFFFFIQISKIHLGAKSGASSESAVAKNQGLKDAGAHVPNSFNDFGEVISQVYQKLVEKHIINPQPELIAPEPPADFKVCSVQFFASDFF